MRKRKIEIISSVLAIVMCISLVAGTTLAVFTAETPINIVLQSGSLNVEAEIADFTLYSAKKSANAEFVDKNGNGYVYEERQGNTFSSGGTANILNRSIVLDKMCAGDKVTFDIAVQNVGDIAVKYNALLSLTEQTESLFFNEMEVELSVKNGDATAKLEPFRSGADSLRTNWKELGNKTSDGNKAVVQVSLALPIDAEMQNMSAKLQCTLSAIQNVPNTSIANVFDASGEPVTDELGNPLDLTDLQEAIQATPQGGTLEIIRSDTVPQNSNIALDKSIKIVSSDGEIKSFSDVHFTVTDGAAVEMSCVGLKGDSYIDVSTATSLSLVDCEIDAAPSRLFDEANRRYLDRAGFIVSNGVQQSGVRLNVDNCKFYSSDKSAAAIYLDGAVADGSSVTNCSFGAEKFVYDATAVQLNSVVGGSRVTLGGNTFYAAATAIGVAQKGSGAYSVYTSNNEMYGGATLLSVTSSAAVALGDSGSKVNDAAVTLDNLNSVNNLLFAGVNVRYNVNNEIIGGEFKLSQSLTREQFVDNYVSGTATDVTVNN